MARFPPLGLTYFWFLNDECNPAHIDKMIASFAAANVSCVCLHPRAGLLLPYGGDDWFAFIRETAQKCVAAGLGVWLYDEDPYPSGNAGGWITIEHPEYRALAIERHVAEPGMKAGENFCFPAGKLLWAGIVPAADDPENADDMTSRVGVLRREWRTLVPWDSRWYYPATPLYHCDRSETYEPEFGLRVPEIPAGAALEAFVARPPGADNPWGALHDSLNPETTKLFLERTHERYYQELGDLFGSEITAIFTDEPKYFDRFPWTAGLFEAFTNAYGYDLRPRLSHLFNESQDPAACLTRIHYREWCGERFEAAWLQPVAEWCRAHKLALVGHISPEDDPVQQANYITNLFPLHKHFDLTGLDLIIPAIGDADHLILNVGIVTAVSVAQQREKIGVMSESLACAGLDFTAPEAARILRWQTAMGLTTPVVHGAFSSTEGHRLIDAPPDYGPLSSRWEGMAPIAEELSPIQERLLGATQAAPVAILWPIRSFQAEGKDWQAEAGGLRRELLMLLHRCLERHVGVHFLDEGDLPDAELADGALRLGQAAYSVVLIPSCTVLHQDSLDRLQQLHEAGLRVYLAGDAPRCAQQDNAIVEAELSWLERRSPETVADDLPRAFEIQSKDIRCTVWQQQDQAFALLYNLGEAKAELQIEEHHIILEPQALAMVDIGCAPAM